MEPKEDGERRPRPVTGAARPLLLAGLLLAAVLIGAGSATANLAGAVPQAPGSALTLLLQTLSLLLVVVCAAVVALFVYALWPAGPRTAQAPRPLGVVRPLLILAVAVLVALLLVRSGVRPFGGSTASPFGGGWPRPPAQASPGSAAGPLDWWLPLLIVGALTVGAAAVAWYVLRPRRPRPGVARGPTAPDAQLVEESLDVLQRERDPRRAVIRAYVAMETSFGARGFPRRPFEAPLEYLARVLGQLQIGSARVAALTELFELARFSHHPIGEAQRTSAIDLLRAIREELTHDRSLADSYHE
jgi:hypothetical protein